MFKTKVSILSAGLFLIGAAFFCLKFSTADAKMPLPKNDATVTTKKDSTVFINGDKMTDESRSIASGSTLETSATAEAQVLINGVGKLQLEKRTRVLLSYDERETSVFLETGCATLWVEPGMKGSLKAKDAEKKIENNRKTNSIEICADRRIGGILLWNAFGVNGGGTALVGGTAAVVAGGVILIQPNVASASSVTDLRR